MRCPVCDAPLDLTDVLSTARHLLTKHPQESLSLISDLGSDFDIGETFVQPPPPEGPHGA